MDKQYKTKPIDANIVRKVAKIEKYYSKQGFKVDIQTSIYSEFTRIKLYKKYKGHRGLIINTYLATEFLEESKIVIEHINKVIVEETDKISNK